MRVQYTCQQNASEFDIFEEEDLAIMTQQIEAALHERHPHLAEQPGQLLIRITDALLNSLADNAEILELGEVDSDATLDDPFADLPDLCSGKS